MEDFAHALADFVRDHQAWAAPIVLVLAFGESLAFISLLIPAWGALVAIGALIGASGISFWPIWVSASIGAAVGDWATGALADVVVDVAIIGTNGLSVARGLTTPDQSESLIKRAMVGAARKCVVLTDSSKAGDDHLHRFAQLADVDVVITDTDLDDDVAAEFRATGPEVVTA